MMDRSGKKGRTNALRRGAGLLLVFLLGVNLPSAEAAALSVKEILKKTESHYQQTQAFTARFRQWTTASAARSMASTEASGTLYYQKPRRMHWQYDKPEPQSFVANNQLAWLYVPSEKTISFYDANTFFASPLVQTLFDGVIELKNHFEISLDSKQSSKQTAVLKLVPRKEDPTLQSLYLWIELDSYRIQIIESHDALGNTNRVALESQRVVSSLDPKLFQLDIPPSTVLLDTDGRELSPADVEMLKKKLTIQ
ncbi:MAG TPA: outer membrane lipoprotein carrier protein LolA [Syntrophobacteraceae bacterium]|nr:outer membrane lipoprotein carrier protein LolA [Syntrophobacteraceae bacterium]